MWFLLCVEFAMHEEKLVEAVHSFRSLWLVSSKSYKDLYGQTKTPGKKWLAW